MAQGTTKAVLLLSGGLDSSSLALAPPEGFDIRWAVSANYGQKHAMLETQAADTVARVANIKHKILNLCGLEDLFSDSALVDPERDVPEGHYEDETMRETVVPNRNMILLSAAIAFAIKVGARAVLCGAHQGDHAIYPDCRPGFFLGMTTAAMFCHYTPVLVVAPYVGMTKAEIVNQAAARMKDPSLLSILTYSCYKGGEIHCGRCGTCTERKEAFQKAGVEDKTLYQYKFFS